MGRLELAYRRAGPRTLRWEAEHSLLSFSRGTGKVAASAFRAEQESGRVLGGHSPFFILTMNVNLKDMPPLPAPTGSPLKPRQGCLAVPQGSLSLLPQGSQGTG